MPWAKRVIDAVQAAELRARRRIASLVAKVQQDLIDSRQAPSGAQKSNAPDYERAKKGDPPLVDTGMLRDTSRWRISGKEAIKVRPPEERSKVVAILENKGFRTVFSGMPTSFAAKMKAIVDDELRKAK